MAFDASNLAQYGSVNGFGLYRYDTTDDIEAVDNAGYMNNKDDDLDLRVGDYIHILEWATAVRTGTITAYKMFVVTNVISNDAAASAGNVNIAEIGVSSSGGVSSLD